MCLVLSKVNVLNISRKFYITIFLLFNIYQHIIPLLCGLPRMDSENVQIMKDLESMLFTVVTYATSWHTFQPQPQHKKKLYFLKKTIP